MIYSNDCWLKTTCKKYLNNDACECKFGDVYCPKLYKLDYLYSQANVPMCLRKPIGLTPTRVDEKVFEELSGIKSNINNFIKDGCNLYIFSKTTGNGKTSWSIKLLQEYFSNIWADTDLVCRGLFVNVPRFLIELKNNIGNKSDYIESIMNNVVSADIVIWDDIGTKVGTEFELEHLYTIINSRLELNKSNIYTSNSTPMELEKSLGLRISSRITKLSHVVELKGIDMRGLV